ncbi:MAG: CpaF family protein [Candidatus Riflebacteria bacterium]|nr:CpaF family protein [Candidatus Riflebacteria bacterium]
MNIQEEIFRRTLGHFLKPVQVYLDDPSVTEVMINGPREIYIERGGKLHKTDAFFDSELGLLAAARNVAQYTGKRITKDSPRVDARLPDGSRVHIITPPASRKGLCIAIRKFSRDVLTMEKLASYGAIVPTMVEFTKIAIMAEKNILVSGGTGSGKTSLLNSLSVFIPDHERVLVLEDSSELRLQQEHVLYFEVQHPDRYGRGGVSIRELFHSCLRLRPDRIIIGEIRGGEALDLIQAMTSGHGGSMSTNHANTPEDALRRLETMALMSGVDMPLFALRSQIASAIDIVVQTSRFNDGSRKVTHIAEVLPLTKEGNYQLQYIFVFKPEGEDSQGKVLGKHVWTSRVPLFGPEVAGKGLRRFVSLTAPIFNLDPAGQGQVAR